MKAALDLSGLSEWIEAGIAEWEAEWEKTQDRFWKGKVEAALIIHDLLLSGEFTLPGTVQQSLARWNEGDRIDFHLRNTQSNEVVIGARVNLFDNQGNALRTAWTGTHGVTYYALLPIDVAKDTLKLVFRVPGFLPAAVSIPNGKKSAFVSMMPDNRHPPVVA
jgi:hypothetical protein